MFTNADVLSFDVTRASWELQDLQGHMILTSFLGVHLKILIRLKHLAINLRLLETRSIRTHTHLAVFPPLASRQIRVCILVVQV